MLPVGDVELRAEFAAGAFAVAEELDEVGRAVAFAALRDVGWDGNGRALHLILDSEILGCVIRDIDIHRELAPAFPDFKVLKSVCVTHRFQFLF